MSAVSFLAGLGAGTVRSERVEREMAMREQEDARRQALFDATMQDRARALADRTALAEAGQPVAVESGEVYQPANDDDGNPMPANPTAGTYKVGAQRFASEGVAQEAAAKEPSKRIQAALMAQGNPVAANQVRTSDLQADAAEAKLKKFAQDAVKEGTMDFLGMATAGASPEELKKTFNATGQKKLKEVVVEPFETTHPVLGKQRSARISGTFEDGTPFEVKDATAEHFAMYGLLRNLDIDFKAKAEKRADENTKADNARADKQLAMTERLRAEQERHNRAVESREQQRIDALTKGSQPGAPLQVSIKDMRDFQGDVQDQIKDQFPIKEGADAAERAKIAAQASAAKARAVSIFQDNAKLGNPLVASTALQAISLAADPKNERVVEVNGRKFGAVIVNGQPVIVTGELQPKGQAVQASPADGISKPVFGAGIPAPATPAAPAAIAQQGVGATPQVLPQHAVALQPLNDQVAQASAALAAAAKSGDPQAVAMYGQKVEQARTARLQEAIRRLGQAGAQAYIASLPQ